MMVAMNSFLNMEPLLEFLMDAVSTLLEVKVCCIYLQDVTGRIELKAARGLAEGTNDFKKIIAQEEYFNFPIKNGDILLGHLVVRVKKPDLIKSTQKIMEIFTSMSGVAIKNCVSFAQLQKNNLELIKLLGRTVELRYEKMHGHIDQVSIYATLLAKKMQLSEDEIKKIECAAILHDIGLLKAPDDFFQKNTGYGIDDYLFLRNLKVEGADFLSRIESMEDIVAIVKHVTEEYDGNGYPEGLVGEQIPLGARIISIVSDFDGLQRFAGVKGPIEALKIIKEKTGSKFDPKLVSMLEKIIYSKGRLAVDDIIQYGASIISNIEQLTIREVELLALIAEGYKNKEIAEILYISEKTVKTHITNIFKKLEVTDRTKAAVMAIQHGLLLNK